MTPDRVRLRPDEAEDDRKYDQTLKEPEDDDEEEDLEEGDENVGLGVGQQDEGEEGADAAVHDGRSDVGQRLLDPLLATSGVLHKESADLKQPIFLF